MAAESPKGCFFAIDSRIWDKVTACGMNEAVAYLALGCGTGRDNHTTSWSSQALHKYAGITWERGKAAIESLMNAGFVRLGKDHTRQDLRYELVALKAAKDESGGDNLIWIPNSIVKGTGSNEPSPIRRLRSAGDVWALRFYVNLYHAQNLRDDGGVNPQVIWQNYERKRIGERGIYIIWGFKIGRKELRLRGPFASHRDESGKKNGHAAWDSVGLLEQMGLLTFIPHLFESSSPQAEPIHPYGIGANGEEPIETSIGEAAGTAAHLMCAEWAIEQAENEGFEYFCPVPRTKPDVQLIGVARLRYRPHTKRTAAWYAQLHMSGNAAISHYEEIAKGVNSRDERISKHA
jgi:hypothetical protein